MSPLPQRRKSPEEIAKLRESFGVPAAEAPATPAPQTPAPVPPPSQQAAPPAAKPPRSLRKSDEAIPRLESPPDSNLPHQRHSREELDAIRRREAMSMMNTPPNKRLFPAHPALVVPGYLITVIAAAGIWFYRFPLWVTAACALAAFAVSGLLFFRHPVSRHHAAFIAVLAMLLLVFASLYYFPQLRHAT
ncbi:MAG: hypothetical protein ACO3JG_09960 [Luteolibacter sp.]